MRGRRTSPAIPDTVAILPSKLQNVDASCKLRFCAEYTSPGRTPPHTAGPPSLLPLSSHRHRALHGPGSRRLIFRLSGFSRCRFFRIRTCMLPSFHPQTGQRESSSGCRNYRNCNAGIARSKERAGGVVFPSTAAGLSRIDWMEEGAVGVGWYSRQRLEDSLLHDKCLTHDRDRYNSLITRPSAGLKITSSASIHLTLLTYVVVKLIIHVHHQLHMPAGQSSSVRVLTANPPPLTKSLSGNKGKPRERERKL